MKMPRELITVQVGQCGNQIASRFWDRAAREHSAGKHQAVYDDAMSRCSMPTHCSPCVLSVGCVRPSALSRAKRCFAWSTRVMRVDAHDILGCLSPSYRGMRRSHRADAAQHSCLC